MTHGANRTRVDIDTFWVSDRIVLGDLAYLCTSVAARKQETRCLVSCLATHSRALPRWAFSVLAGPVHVHFYCVWPTHPPWVPAGCSCTNYWFLYIVSYRQLPGALLERRAWRCSPSRLQKAACLLISPHARPHARLAAQRPPCFSIAPQRVRHFVSDNCLAPLAVTSLSTCSACRVSACPWPS